MIGMNFHLLFRFTTPTRNENSNGKNGQGMFGRRMNLTPLPESRFSVCPEFASTTLIQAISATSGRDFNSAGHIGYETSSTAFISDSMTQMAKEFSADVLRYAVPRDIIIKSAATLRSLSGGHRESVVLWTGTHHAEVALVQRIIVPCQWASSLHFDVPLQERIRIMRQITSCGERLLAQLHTHPSKAFHSPADDRLALPRHTGAISIVIPNFAEKWSGDLQETSVNRHLGGGVWEELSREAVSILFEVH